MYRVYDKARLVTQRSVTSVLSFFFFLILQASLAHLILWVVNETEVKHSI